MELALLAADEDSSLCLLWSRTPSSLNDAEIKSINHSVINIMAHEIYVNNVACWVKRDRRVVVEKILPFSGLNKFPLNFG